MNRVKQLVHAENVYRMGYTGKNIRVVTLDTGVYLHPDLRQNVVGFLDFVAMKRACYDDNGHGTHVGTVTDDELIVSFLDMVENHKMIVENSGLLTVAALKHLNVKDKRVVSILSGGNMDVITMSSVVQQGLIFRDRIFTVSVLLPDKPGELAKVSETLAKEQGNVIKLEHNQFVSTNRNAAVELRITLECFGTDHKKQIIKALEKAGYKPKIVRTMI